MQPNPGMFAVALDEAVIVTFIKPQSDLKAIYNWKPTLAAVFVPTIFIAPTVLAIECNHALAYNIRVGRLLA
jgi:hypothetical protein